MEKQIDEMPLSDDKEDLVNNYCLRFANKNNMQFKPYKYGKVKWQTTTKRKKSPLPK